MHYVPDSARDFLPDDAAPRSGAGLPGASFHYQSAPVYLLTLVVGALLAADLLIGLFGDPAWASCRAPFGYRLALLAAVLGGGRILYQTLDGLFEGRVGAELALSIAALAAILLGEHTTAALVVFIALCGESLEGYTLDRAQSAIRRIFDLCPNLAHVVRSGREVDVPVDQVREGETVTIRPGERVPVDGTVLTGSSTVDQSALTGESLPVDKQQGSEVFTGTLNQYGSLSVVAKKVGGETTLAQVVELVAQATQQKTPLERTADRLARVFLPFVLGAALLTLFAWWLIMGDWRDAVRPALAVLVVACPCPLILATPTAVIAAMAWLARHGVVVKGSAALESLAAVDTIAFDKTGTLTRGELSLTEIVALPPCTETELLRVAAIAERRSEHLLARLIVREAESRNLVVPGIDDFTSHPGAGVVARIRATLLGSWVDSIHGDDQPPTLCTVVVGNRGLLDSRQIAVNSAFDDRLSRIEETGATTLLVAVDGRLLGAIGVRDELRDETRAVIAELKEAGVKSFLLLTGDRLQAARSVANALGVFDEVAAGFLPADKARLIEEQKSRGHRVAMVGDGINDAPALAAADVGIALGGVGSDIAAEAGSLVLMGDPLRPLPGLFRLSQALVRNIRQSILVFAFGMNAVGILLSSVGVLSPVLAAVFHELASLAVMLNATRLLAFERPDSLLSVGWELFTRIAEWLTQALSPSRWVFRLIENRSVVVGLLVPAAVFVWLLSGIVRIHDNEQAFVTRFGRADVDLPAGIHWRLPAPFERVYREPADKLQTVQIGFRATNERTGAQSSAGRAPIEWTSEHNEASFESRPDESLVLTGDEVLVEMTAEVQWRITDVRQYALGSVRPAETLRTVAETALREMAARQTLDGILTERRQAIEEECLARLRDRIKPLQLGIEVTELTLLDVHPPRPAVSAYRDVADALEEKEQRVNEAEAYYAGRLLRAAGERAVSILNDAAADSKQRFDKTTPGGVSGWTLTETLWSKLNRESSPSGLVLSGEAASVLLAAREAATQTTQAAGGQADRFKELLGAYRSQPELTSRHLYWQAVTDSLAGRAVTIVDPKAGGHKRLFLGSPDDLRGGVLIRDAGSEASPTNSPSNTTLPEPPTGEARSPEAPRDQPADSGQPSNR
ncbi:MAG TPA: cation-translocating P-type ATPase family protein [Planctomycetaceae bacterium]|jgi:Cu+-exporting ATPase|nr:cation-translocating P-type ATPase family protein [Planctomycetaceae bacterium]